MTDEEIIVVVQAHKEGKQIQYRCKGAPEDDWWDFGPNCHFNFGLADYRVKPEPRKITDLWLQECGDGLWQEKFYGIGTHFIADTNPSEGKLPKVSESREPREWWVGANYHAYNYEYEAERTGTCIKVREVIEE